MGELPENKAKCARTFFHVVGEKQVYGSFVWSIPNDAIKCSKSETATTRPRLVVPLDV